jgi:hypothetical protein
MTIPIPIPIGATYMATVQGTVWKLVCCERCQQPYAYLLELEASAAVYDVLFVDGAGSAAMAQEQAEQKLKEKGRNMVVPIPCPNCGFYQNEMARRLKDDASINSFQIAGVIIMVLSFLPLLFRIAYLWVLTVALAVIGLSLLVWGYVVTARFDPNAGDPAARKAFGRSRAVWGEQLAQLLATNPRDE